jgi:hypothetical protein
MPLLADDNVVVHGNAERLRHLDDLLGHLDVGAGRRHRVMAADSSSVGRPAPVMAANMSENKFLTHQSGNLNGLVVHNHPSGDPTVARRDDHAPSRPFTLLTLPARQVTVFFLSHASSSSTRYSTAFPILTNVGPILSARQFRKVPTVISPRYRCDTSSGVNAPCGPRCV